MVSIIPKSQIVGSGNRRKMICVWLSQLIFCSKNLSCGRIDGVILRRRFLVIFWKGKYLSRVMAFSWKRLLERISMKSKLAIHKIIQPEDSAEYALCELDRETSTYLLLFCVLDRRVWNLVMRWIYFWFIYHY
jgi:hypothetical protein